jgi:hypothetical protein
LQVFLVRLLQCGALVAVDVLFPAQLSVLHQFQAYAVSCSINTTALRAGFAAGGSAFRVLQVPISPIWLQTCDLCVLAGLACLWMHSPVVLPMHSWRAIVWLLLTAGVRQLIDRHSVVWC